MTTLNISGELIKSLSDPRINGMTKILILDNTPIKDFTGLRKNGITKIVANFSSIKSLAGLGVAQKCYSISLKETPVSKEKCFRLSLVILLGNTLVSINGKCIPESIRQKAALYPPIAKDLINAGWIATYPVPSDDEFAKLAELFNISGSSNDIPSSPIKPPTEFAVNQSLVGFVRKCDARHKAMIKMYNEMFNQINTDANEYIQGQDIFDDNKFNDDDESWDSFVISFDDEDDDIFIDKDFPEEIEEIEEEEEITEVGINMYTDTEEEEEEKIREEIPKRKRRTSSGSEIPLTEEEIKTAKEEIIKYNQSDSDIENFELNFV